MKIVTLIENTACAPELCAEHGLSLYVEAAGRKILFDAGQTEAFADNAARLGVALSEVDMAILSHGHYDHGGGLKRFLALNDHAPVYVNRLAFEPHHSASGKYIGLDGALAECGRIVWTDDECRIGDALTLCTCNGRAAEHPLSGGDLTVTRAGSMLPEDFRHEQYLIVQEGGRRIVFSGCSHKGILNIMEWLRPDVLVGGFHFKGIDPEGEGRAELERAAEALLRYPAVYYTGHCTGGAQYDILKARMGDRLHAISGGCVLSL